MLARLGSMAARGFAMGAADIVPGVSGGTIALVFGIYEKLLHNVGLGAKALGSLVKGDVDGFRRRFVEIDWLFILPLGAGVLLAVGLLSSIIEQLLHDRPEEMAGLFFGLVLGSIVVAWRLLDDRSTVPLSIIAVVGVAAFVLLGLQSGPVASPPLLAFFGAGAIAICAMILPGISGSFLLLMMGMYAALLGAVDDRDVVSLAVFFVGAVLGLALFSTALNYLLDNYRDPLLAALIGLMVGSLRVLWPWPNGVGIISDEESESISGTGLGWPDATGDLVVPIVLAVVAFAVVVAVSGLAQDKTDEAVRTTVKGHS